ncbi:MAG: hypothetical protein FWC96_01090 [Oscillospiraceae bacterium]|nr:hypothetical protein [Oscillospiraceae bacterium]
MKRRKKRTKGIFKKMAVQHGVSVGEVELEIQAAVDAAWENPDPATQARQRELFPDGKPSIDEFVRVMAEKSRND